MALVEALQGGSELDLADAAQIVGPQRNQLVFHSQDLMLDTILVRPVNTTFDLTEYSTEMRDSQFEKIIYREATITDSMAVAGVHVRSWRESFRGIVPQSFLDNMSVESRTTAFEARFTTRDYRIYVAEADQHGLVGFADFGPPRDIIDGYEAELYAIYLLPEFQGSGVGAGLFRRGVEDLVKDGVSTMYLLALEVSPYRSFYEKMGGRVIAKRQKELDGDVFDVLVYGWDRLG